MRRGERDFGWKIAKGGTWEPHIIKTLASIVREGATVVDIGANVGVMTLCAAKAAGPKGRVIVVEPNRDNLQMLYAGIVRNGFRNVRVLPFAASDAATIFSLDGGTSNTYVTEAAMMDVVFPIVGEYFAEVRPAATMIVCGLVKPEMKIEIEVTAFKG